MISNESVSHPRTQIFRSHHDPIQDILSFDLVAGELCRTMDDWGSSPPRNFINIQHERRYPSLTTFKMSQQEVFAYA